MRPDQAERRTHDYTRHGTVSLFAALYAATGKVIGRCFARHRAREFHTFLNTVQANAPEDLDVHIVMDNASSHKTQGIRNRFAKRPRWQVHCTPTSASWLNQVERFFANLSEKQLRRVVHRSTADLEAGHSALHRRDQRRSQTLRLDQIPRRHLGHNQALLHDHPKDSSNPSSDLQNFRTGTLATFAHRLAPPRQQQQRSKSVHVETDESLNVGDRASPGLQPQNHWQG